MAMQLIIDRFEEGFAICEKSDRSLVRLPCSALPLEAREGDVLMVVGGTVRVDKAETERRKRAAEQKLKDLWR